MNPENHQHCQWIANYHVCAQLPCMCTCTLLQQGVEIVAAGQMQASRQTAAFVAGSTRTDQNTPSKRRLSLRTVICYRVDTILFRKNSKRAVITSRRNSCRGHRQMRGFASICALLGTLHIANAAFIPARGALTIRTRNFATVQRIAFHNRCTSKKGARDIRAAEGAINFGDLAILGVIKKLRGGDLTKTKVVHFPG